MPQDKANIHVWHLNSQFHQLLKNSAYSYEAGIEERIKEY